MKSLEDISPSDVTQVMHQKNYEVFESAGVPNIVGIRNAQRIANHFDDKCFVWWKKDNDKNEWHEYTITTDPGLYYLLQPIEGTKGTAILVPGQYLNCWELGMHRGKQLALIQTRGQVRVYRDDNKDDNLNYDPETIDTGFFGINLHHSSLDDVDVINRYSAGCQVWRYHQAHEILMQTFTELSNKYNFNRFSYTLLQQEDFS